MAAALAVSAGTLSFRYAAVGQSNSFSLSGTVSDASGAVLPDTKVIVTNNETMTTDIVNSNESGRYTVPNIPSGDYTVHVEAPGFQAYDVTNVPVDPEHRATV